MMKRMTRKPYRSLGAAVTLALCLLALTLQVQAKYIQPGPNGSGDCVSCHAQKSPGIVNDWKRSQHARARVSCLDCHRAEKSDPDARLHEGARISVIVSPRDCFRCHPAEVRQFGESLHDKAASFIQALPGERGDDDELAYRVEGKAAAVRGCEQCHGTRVIVREGGRLDPESWPNTGIGRINPDGSRGSCTACHTRHRFSIGEARRPEACGTCHMGPDHPQLEIYLESKHGVIYQAEKEGVAWEVPANLWDTSHYRFPTCATCHMSRVGGQPATHNVSARLSWELERPLSVKTVGWQEKRARMQQVCLSCHSRGWVEGYYRQADRAVELYNTKFYGPMKKMMDELYAAGILTPTKFDEEIEFKFFEFWHHEGRRARAGAFMMGPDFTQWHGFYELARGIIELKKMAQEIREGKGGERIVKGKGPLAPRAGSLPSRYSKGMVEAAPSVPRR